MGYLALAGARGRQFFIFARRAMRTKTPLALCRVCPVFSWVLKGPAERTWVSRTRSLVIVRGFQCLRFLLKCILAELLLQTWSRAIFYYLGGAPFLLLFRVAVARTTARCPLANSSQASGKRCL